MVKMLEINEELEESAVSDLESKLNITLPVSYREFLRKYNGGAPLDSCFDFKGQLEGSMVNRFLGIHNKEFNNLIKYLETYKHRIPNDFLPIANDPGGNLICISVKGKNKGKVYFWDHEEENGENGTEDYSNVILIADNFDDFISSLYKIDNLLTS